MIGPSAQSNPSPQQTAAALAISPSPADRVRLREILSPANWKLYEASGCREAMTLLREQSVPVVLCERDQTDCNWEEFLDTTARLPAAPNLIVFSRLADESLWAKVLNLGGFDVLVKPFDPEEVLRVALAAWSRWEYDFGTAPPEARKPQTAHSPAPKDTAAPPRRRIVGCAVRQLPRNRPIPELGRIG